MEHWEVLLPMVLLVVKAQSQGAWLSIDCGSPINYPDPEGAFWQADEGFIKTGENRRVNIISPLNVLNSMRVFRQRNKNCYILPTGDTTRHFIRASFHYGNYDLLAKPPTFDIEIDGNKWITVVSSLEEPVYYEIIYPSRRDRISVCLARTRPDEFPYISSLEVWPLPGNLYYGMNRDLAWLKSSRLNYGAQPQDKILGIYGGDKYNRIWEPSIPDDLNPVSADTSVYHYIVNESPPPQAMFDAVEGTNRTKSISLTLQIAKPNSQNYIEAYFTEMRQLGADEKRSFGVYVNNKSLITSPEYQNITGVWALALASGALTLELHPTADSTLPPIISAIEVYTASDPLVRSETSQDDLDGLAVLIRTFEQLGGWSGEPCLPSDTVWQWLGCNGSDPPRVTSLYLSGYGLRGALPEFNQMRSLGTIDLGNNSLTGTIPEFLGNLPNLRQLNLADNDFSGDVPRSITNNKKIKYSIHGNPRMHQKKGTKTAMLIGLAVGTPLAVILIVAALVYLLQQKAPKPNQEQATAPAQPEDKNDDDKQGAHANMEPEDISAAMSPETVNHPTYPNLQCDIVPFEDDITDSALPDMDVEELEELVRLKVDSVPASVDQYNGPNHGQGNIPGVMDAGSSDHRVEENMPPGTHGGTPNEFSGPPDMDIEELDKLLIEGAESSGQLRDDKVGTA